MKFFVVYGVLMEFWCDSAVSESGYSVSIDLVVLGVL
jgi:hypothetical protein